MPRRPPQTLIDYLIVAVAPALIMVLVGSLAFFLIEVLYHGDFPTRLRLVCALFVFAAVLVCRIAVEEGREHATLFAIPLAVASLLAMHRFVGEGLMIHLLLLSITWWSAHKLTWDCTVVDETTAASGDGLLQTMGWDAGAHEGAGAAPEVESTVSPDADASSHAGWRRWIPSPSHKHAPGVWIIYFCAASLPLFGLGQLALSSATLPRRRAFVFLCLYVASALGLLLATSLLQLRKYLRQRRVAMPADMAGVWLGMGATLIFAILLAAWLLPRPSPEYSLLATSPSTAQGTREQSTSRLHVLREGSYDSKQPGSEDASGPADDPTAAPNRNGRGNATQQGSESGEREFEVDESGENGSSSDEPSTQQPSSANRSSGRNADKGAVGDESPREAQNGHSSSTRRAPDGARGEDRAAPQTATPSQQSSSPNPPPNPVSPPASVWSIGQMLAVVARGIYWVLVACIVGWLLWRYRVQIVEALRAFVVDIRAWWQQLWGRSADAHSAPAEPSTEPVRLPSFSDFQDPFVPSDSQRSLKELAQYSFAALEAWGRDHNIPRQAEQTPLEFATGLGMQFGSLRDPARQAAAIYSRIAYSDFPPTALDRESLRQLWTALRES